MAFLFCLRSLPATNLYSLQAAPAGLEKTLAVFLDASDKIVKQGIMGMLLKATQLVYVLPVMAPGSDMEQNQQILTLMKGSCCPFYPFPMLDIIFRNNY
jgi:hypothetical protein